MIPRHAVHRAIVTWLAAHVTDAAITDQVGPTLPAPATIVVTLPGGSGRYGGVKCPEGHLALRVDLRTVVTASDVAMAARECLRVADTAVGVFLDGAPTITGTGWAITGRRLVSDSGIDHDANQTGATANNVATVELLVAVA